MAEKLMKADLSKEIARVCETTRKDSRQLLEIILDAMAGALSRGERVEIRGFGSFGTRMHRSWVGTNPSTGAILHVPAKRVPYFKAFKEAQESAERAAGQRHFKASVMLGKVLDLAIGSE